MYPLAAAQGRVLEAHTHRNGCPFKLLGCGRSRVVKVLVARGVVIYQLIEKYFTIQGPVWPFWSQLAEQQAYLDML